MGACPAWQARWRAERPVGGIMVECQSASKPRGVSLVVVVGVVGGMVVRGGGGVSVSQQAQGVHACCVGCCWGVGGQESSRKGGRGDWH